MLDDKISGANFTTAGTISKMEIYRAAELQHCVDRRIYWRCGAARMREAHFFETADSHACMRAYPISFVRY